jgi:membrane associated rhomboid family serine protease
MWFLWIFGDNIEERFGRLRFILFYLAAGIAAGLAQYAVDPASQIPMLGASGAVAGVLGAYWVFFPRHTIDTLVPVFGFIRIVPLPAMVMIGYWFLIQIFSGVGSLAAQTAATGGVAFFAHIGGFLAGLAFAKLSRRRQR